MRSLLTREASTDRAWEGIPQAIAYSGFQVARTALTVLSSLSRVGPLRLLSCVLFSNVRV